ncbi:MAG: DUF2914 domain-containing protein [Fibrobacter sp.]|nr:DUF2914 domain-containing protein [Fibrobacter sp.]
MFQNILQNPVVQKLRKFFPAAAFFGGFTWDSITLGKLVQTTDLAILLLYYVASLVFLLLLAAEPGKFLNRTWSEKWQNRFTYAVQFCFGSLFSALVVCYFKSSGSFGAFFLVALLAVFLVANEFLQQSYAKFGFSLALFNLLGTMYLNFLIPHLVNGIGFFWFFVSVLISFGICFGAFKLSRRPSKVLIAPVAISAALLVAYLLNWIAPVPLVLKDQNACTGFSKDYTCYVDEKGFVGGLSVYLGFSPTLSIVEGEGVTFVSAVFAPAKVETQLEHRWYHENPQSGKYELLNTITSARMTTRGSREEGFRIYTTKKNVPEGKWKVETAVKDGSVIGSKTFYVKKVPENAPKRVLWKIR